MLLHRLRSFPWLTAETILMLHGSCKREIKRGNPYTLPFYYFSVYKREQLQGIKVNVRMHWCCRSKNCQTILEKQSSINLLHLNSSHYRQFHNDLHYLNTGYKSLRNCSFELEEYDFLMNSERIRMYCLYYSMKIRTTARAHLQFQHAIFHPDTPTKKLLYKKLSEKT